MKRLFAIMLVLMLVLSAAALADNTATLTYTISAVSSFSISVPSSLSITVGDEATSAAISVNGGTGYNNFSKQVEIDVDEYTGITLKNSDETYSITAALTTSTSSTETFSAASSTQLVYGKLIGQDTNGADILTPLTVYVRAVRTDSKIVPPGTYTTGICFTCGTYEEKKPFPY